MRTPTIATLRGASLLVLTLFFAGCASQKSGYEKGAATGTGLQKAADRIDSGNLLIDQVLTNLADLVNNPQPDLQPQYQRFSESVSKLHSTASHVRESSLSMIKKGNDYFKSWDQDAAQIQNEDIRARSETRKAEVSQSFQGIKRKYAEAEIAFRPFMSDLQDVQRYLSNDLTPGGVAAIKDLTPKTSKDAEPLKGSIKVLSDEFRKLGVKMAPAAPVAAAPVATTSAPAPAPQASQRKPTIRPVTTPVLEAQPSSRSDSFFLRNFSRCDRFVRVVS